jgi:uncharacterized protein (TIGR02145 family)
MIKKLPQTKLPWGGIKRTIAIILAVCLVITAVILLRTTTTHADSNITLTINNEKVIALEKDSCTSFTLDTVTTTTNSLGYTMKAYVRTNTAGNNIEIKKQDGTTISNNPKTPTEAVSANTTSINGATTTSYQACSDNTIAPDDYSIRIAYVLFENFYTKVASGANFQDTTPDQSETCGALPIYDKNNPNPASTIMMTDNRNGQEYRVRKMPDGKCWMIDNMKLAGRTLTSVDSNTTDPFVIPVNPVQDTTTHDNGECYTNSGVIDNTSKADGDGQLTCDGTTSASTSNFNFAAYSDPTITDACKAGTGVDPSSTTGCGYLYNWFTSGRICPARWKTPSVGDSLNPIDDLATLNGAMANGGAPSTGSSVTYAANWISTGPFSGSYAGGYSTGAFSGQGSSGLYWAKNTVLTWTTGFAWRLIISDSNVYVGDYGNKYVGYSVRCLVS